MSDLYQLAGQIKRQKPLILNLSKLRDHGFCC